MKNVFLFVVLFFGVTFSFAARAQDSTHCDIRFPRGVCVEIEFDTPPEFDIDSRGTPKDHPLWLRFWGYDQRRKQDFLVDQTYYPSVTIYRDTAVDNKTRKDSKLATCEPMRNATVTHDAIGQYRVSNVFFGTDGPWNMQIQTGRMIRVYKFWVTKKTR